MAGGSPAMTMSASKVEVVRGTHQFKIIGYSLQKDIVAGQYIPSGNFEVGGYEWTVQFYPNGNNPYDVGYVSVFLELKSRTSNVKALYSFEIYDPTGKSSLPSIYKRSDKANIFSSSTAYYGYTRFLERSKLESQYVIDDCLTVQCTVEVVKGICVRGTKKCSITVPPSNIGEHFFQFLESKQGTDVTFQVGECTFDAHKLVLAMRSPVFNAEFFGAMREKSTRYIRIEDMEPIVFKALLHFIYTDTLPLMDNFVGDAANKGATAEWARRLLVAADRYDLERMRLMCANMLCEIVSVETVARTLKLADQHHCQHLKEFCIEYIASPEILKTVMTTDDFKDFKESCPSVLEEILEKSVAFAIPNRAEQLFMGSGSSTMSFPYHDFSSIRFGGV